MTKQKHLIKSFFLTLTPLSLNDCLISATNQASLASFHNRFLMTIRRQLFGHLPAPPAMHEQCGLWGP